MPHETETETITNPQIGMVATVRNRRGIISGVRPFDGHAGTLHLVDIEYNDGETPLNESLLWERELPFAHLLSPAALPDPASTDPMPYDDMMAMVRACRWTASMPFIDPDGSGPMARLPVTSPFHGAVQIEDYQLVPLLKALRMPRVSLLLADDVGLGKTIEAGLILSELLLRRRIRRVLIITPASLRVQWRDELWDKFSLPFDLVDRDSTVKIRRQLGLDANPWRSSSRIITSYHYLKQPDIIEQFRSASEYKSESARLPWDLLIVDEAHNLTPAPFGDESDLCKMLRQISPMFEHKLFLTATPHNGHTRSFTGLLEMLDPVRFTQTNELKPAERARIQDVLVRRLKREINERSEPKKFCDRLPPQALLITPGAEEKRLFDAFSDFRDQVRSLMAKAGRRRSLAGNFAIEILGKRLLSCPVAFADSWQRCKAGMLEPEEVSDEEVIAARKSVAEETADDRETDSRTKAAAATVGAWLKPLAEDLSDETEAIDQAILALGLSEGEDVTGKDPLHDSRYEALKDLIAEMLMDDDRWRDDERLVIFTEYKTTLDYLLRRLREETGAPERMLCLFGGMNDFERKKIKEAFNDPGNPVRILIATDAASEGLNLQNTARYLLHFDLPWNPAKLEQRNGRLDRYGQARDVSVWHFCSDEQQDLAFLDFVVNKVHAIREDLGATGDLFDEATHRRLIEGESLSSVQTDLELRLEVALKQADVPRDDKASIDTEEEDPAGNLTNIAAELDYDPESSYQTLDTAMAVGVGRPRLSEPGPDGCCQVIPPIPAVWGPVVDDTIRFTTVSGSPGALPSLTFNPQTFVEELGGRPIFRPRKDTVLLHLGHPLLQQAITSLNRLRFPGGERSVSRWTVTHGKVPESSDALLLLHIEELAVNELRETFHHWVRTLQFPISDGKLGIPMPHVPATSISRPGTTASTADLDTARDIWVDISEDLRELLKRSTIALTEQIQEQQDLDKERALEDESERYKSRQGEVSALIASSTMERLERELEKLKTLKKQGVLFDQDRMLDAIDRDIELKEEELKRRRQHYEEVRKQLARERERILNFLIPNRYSMRGEAQLMPVAIEIVLPGNAS